MTNYCEDCGCKVFAGACTNCHEEIFIEEQYIELGMEMPDKESDFMIKLDKCKKQVANKINQQQ